MDETIQARILEAIALIASTPGYGDVASRLARKLERDALRFVPHLIDRGQASLLGKILLGPEALEGGLVSLAQTLVHEEYHARQNPLEKTSSFWLGVATGAPAMRRYERPAYRAAVSFLAAVADAFPAQAAAARAEAQAVAQSFQQHYRAPL